SAAGATPGSILAKLLIQCITLLENSSATCITLLENSSATVNAIICDGASTNKSMLSQLGIHGKKENFSLENALI
uniref:Transposable element P transposase-like RNase H domain-containing protein n=1 Tax=Strigamia maritima TaxID=126957 RepID=T1IHD8_STRMM